ncbi:hypothetical protein KP509_15G057000 [Ceratopteris richardii]|uniref:Aminotransferase class I/classII large domain-containing protein n=1 Tax=Ceratopteris richardii TaxID=49495 RepID=A0A8T2T9W3_CERRI|nr:hypothetical protein KP509_15G057000 [Ceratopteris richardii]
MTATSSFLARRTFSFHACPIQQLSRLAQSRNAINLAEGFPDFPAPEHIKQAAISAILEDYNQYRHVQAACDEVAKHFSETQGVQIDPTNITLCCGQSEAFAASIMAVVDVGDEVLLLDPCYETYEACIALAGGCPVYVRMKPPYWTIDMNMLEASISSRSKAIVVNSPHNPTGKVFSMQELTDIAELCVKYDLLAITDEVYEHITYGNAKHISLASLPGMVDRTVITSSLSKTFSVTGWRLGWAIAPPEIAPAVSNIHVKISDSAPAPFQEAAVIALRSSNDYFVSLRKEYEERRDFVLHMLRAVGFEAYFKPEGSMFVFVELPVSSTKDDVEYATELIEKAGVAIVPGHGFFHNNKRESENFNRFCIDGMGKDTHEYTRRYVRIAFCKSKSTLFSAARAWQSYPL